MEFTYDELLAAQFRYGTTEKDIIERAGYEQILTNVVIAPWWETSIFANSDLIITKINDRVYNLHNEDIEFSFVQVKQIGAPAIIEEILSLGATKCKKLIFIGSAGALKEEIKIGDLAIPKLSICGDGASRYLNKDLKDDFGEIAKPNIELTEQILAIAKKICVKEKIKVHKVNNFSIDTIFAQFPHIENIIERGVDVIEMETYTLFKAARIVGINVAAIFCISDNTVIKRSLFSGRNEADKILRHQTKELIIPQIIIECFKKEE